MSKSVKVARIPMCDIHKYNKGQNDVPAVVDGKTSMGPWAFMCEECFMDYGVGLGTGAGQRLVLESVQGSQTVLRFAPTKF